MNSIFEIFKIGIGPSSSHTVAPMKAAKLFIDKISENDLKNIRVTVKQSLLIKKYIELNKYKTGFIKVSTLLQKTGCSVSILNLLVKKKIFNTYEKRVSRFLEVENKLINKNNLTDFQIM